MLSCRAGRAAASASLQYSPRVSPTPPNLALLGGPEPWPLTGHVRGALAGPDVSVAWVGRALDTRGGPLDPQAGWRASRSLDAALRAGGSPHGDRRRVLAVLWSRLEGKAPLPGLTLLLASRDADGVALSGVGLSVLHGVRDKVLHPWLQRPHPLLSPPGLPASVPGALVADDLPDWIIGVPDDPALTQDPTGQPVERVFARCGVHG